MRRLTLFFAALALWTGFAARGDDKLFEEFRWREVGPCAMGGRITDIAVVESKPQQFYVAAATGGVWKTVNNGATWTPIFDAYGTSSIGDIAVNQAHPDIVWVGTGEANARNSVIAGDGVYKSTDGGKTFQNVGLGLSRHIGRIALHPKNPDIAFVAALGDVWVPSKERGVYKTADGGATWRAVLTIDENTGGVDVAVDPRAPDVVYAAMYAVRRDAYSGSGSPSVFSTNAGIFKSTDGGETWKKLTQGLPTVGVGRIGLDIYRKNSKIVYAIIETKPSGAPPSRGGTSLGVSAEEQEAGVVLTGVRPGGPAEKAGLKVGDIIKEFGGKKISTYEELTNEIQSRKPDDKVQVAFVRDGEAKTVEVTLSGRQDISFQDDVNRGGVFRSEDRGETWEQVNTLNPRAFYFSQIRVDPSNDQRVYVLGVSVHVSTDGGKKFSANGAPTIHVDHHAMWIDPKDPDHLLLGNDGGIHVSYDRGKTWEMIDNLPIGQFYAIGLDMQVPYWIYGGIQDNGTWGGPSCTRNPAITNGDWTTVMGADGFVPRVDPTDPDTIYCEGQYGMTMRVDRKTGAQKSIRPRGSLRFEWKTPLELSPHDAKRVYLAAHKVFESGDRGDTWKEISADLTKTPRGSISALAVSPLDENVLWAGTNDGGVWVTRDRGKTWSEVPPPSMERRWVTHLEASRTHSAVAYLTLDGRRVGDPATHAMRTSDYGVTWTSIAGTLPQEERAYVLREDPKNTYALYLGTERGVYVTIDRGATWSRLGRGLPVVPVFDLAVHPRDGELVAATHGRSIWILDVRPLQQCTAKVLRSKAFLFAPSDAIAWNPGKAQWFGGAREFHGTNPPRGPVLSYYLSSAAADISLIVKDGAGKTIATLKPNKDAGLHRLTWTLPRGRGRIGPGTYEIALSVDGNEFKRTLRILADPRDAPPPKIKRDY